MVMSRFSWRIDSPLATALPSAYDRNKEETICVSDDLNRLTDRAIRKLSDKEAFDHIGHLIDLSADAAFARGAQRALYLLDELEQRALNPEYGALLHYFRANAWSLKGRLAGHGRSWVWEQAETLQEILALSRAASHDGFAALNKIRQCQILTNRANLLNGIGRFIDALEGWDRALGILPTFAMANGNRALGLKHYAGALHDPGHRGYFLLAAYDAAVAATAKGTLFDAKYRPSVAAGFRTLASDIAAHAPIEAIRASQDLDSFSLGRGKKEQSYRRWCLNERLFLNPLNDLGPHTIAARDVLTLPALTEVNMLEETEHLMPPVFGYYNQMKQEFASARYMLFDGITASGVHFSDRGVLLYNTLDYPSFSLAMEQVRASFRIAYSLLDKIAYLINSYWALGKVEDRISFRSIWFQEGKSALHPQFAKYENWPLRGLFWLSKEIFDEELKQTTNPDARELHDLRNHIEHKYLQVHEGWASAVMPRRSSVGALGKSISSIEMEAKALRVMKIARSALCYLPLAVGREERLRAQKRPKGLSLPMTISTWEDNWKRAR
jgi:hypothetical protein